VEVRVAVRDEDEHGVRRPRLTVRVDRGELGPVGGVVVDVLPMIVSPMSGSTSATASRCSRCSRLQVEATSGDRITPRISIMSVPFLDADLVAGVVGDVTPLTLL
jgi:hypothetical protein